jgi:hypothetical protein
MSTRSDYSAIRDEQKAKAFALWGTDSLAGNSIPPFGARTPFTPADYALVCAEFWRKTVGPILPGRIVVLKDVDVTYDTDGCKSIATAIGAALKDSPAAVDGKTVEWFDSSSFPPEHKTSKMLDVFSTHCRGDELRRFVSGVVDMYTAIKAGGFSRTTNETGARVMDPIDCRLFWDATSECAVVAQAVMHTPVETNSYWQTFKAQAKTEADAAAEAAGQAAGAVLGAAGSAFGKGIGSFLDELGIGKVATIGAAGYVAWRFL